MPTPQPVYVIESKEQAAVLLQGERSRYLKLLAQPASATSLAQQLKSPRQKVNYHLRALENVGLVELVGQRKARNCTERLLQATALEYILSPAIIADLCEENPKGQDRFSSAYLLTLAAQTIRELGELRQKAKRVEKTIATLSMAADIRFPNAKARAEFAEELTSTTAALIDKYHQPDPSEGRDFKFMLGVYPALKPSVTADEPGGET